MGTSVPAVGEARRGGGALATAMVALALVFSLGSRAFAADLSATPNNGLNVTGSVAAVLPAAESAASVLPTTTAATSVLDDTVFTVPADSWLSGFHASGFLSQTFGMWQNPSALRWFTPSRNNLATSRTWLQVDENLRIDHNNNLFMREWFVYEPPYAFVSANGLGKYGNEFYNQYTVRDAWWENKTGPLTTYVGNQIVVWGQSLAFRVGDVVNPQDTTWAFGFANLEQSRIPQWMIHPILNLPEMGPLSSNFVEGILLPRLQPMWNSCDYADHRYDGECNVNGGTVNNGFPAGVGFLPTGRFGAHFNTKFYPGITAITNPPDGWRVPPNAPYQNSNLFNQPFANAFFYCTNLGSGIQPFNPVPKGLQRNCSGFENGFDVGQWKIPASTVANWNEGIRFHTLIGPLEATAFYYNAWNLYPVTFWQQYTNQFRNKFTPENMFGITADAPLPVPGSLGEYLPLVGRVEGVYTNHQPTATWDYVGNPTGVQYTDTVNWMIAVDVDQAYAPWLTKTGNLSANIEVEDNIAMDCGGSCQATAAPWSGGGLESEATIKNNVSTLFNIGTSWLWNDIQPAWTMVYSPKGNTFLLFPSVVLNPPWTKKYFVKFQAIEVLGGDNAYAAGGGILKGQSLLTAQLQYNFNLL